MSRDLQPGSFRAWSEEVHPDSLCDWEDGDIDTEDTDPEEMAAVRGFQFWCKAHSYGWNIDEDGTDYGCTECLDEQYEEDEDYAMRDHCDSIYPK